MSNPNALISLSIDGVEVTGRFLYRSENAIEVELVAPFGPLSMWHRMPAFSRRLLPGGLLGNEGTRQAARIVRRLYHLLKRISIDVDAVRAMLTAYDAIASSHHTNEISDEFFIAFRDQIAENVKAGEMDKRTAARHMSHARRQHSRYHERVYEARVVLVEQIFGKGVPPELHEQLIAHARRA